MPKNNLRSQLRSPLSDLTPVVRQYLDLCDNSTNVVKFMCDKTNERSSSPENESIHHGDHTDCLNRSESFHDGRAPSPSSISSLASGRRLEWDSGADVGYQPSASIYPCSLSTLERMALGGCAESLIRTDPEGTNSCTGSGVNPIHASAVKSFPSVSSDSKTVSLTKVTSPREVSGIINLSKYANNEAVSVKSVKKDKDNLDNNSINISGVGNDLVNGNIPVSEISGNESFHNIVEGTCPINALVNENMSSDEDVVATPLASAVHTNSASSSSLASTIIPHNPESLLLQSKKPKNLKKRMTRGIQVGGTLGKCEARQFRGGSFLSPRNDRTVEGEKKESLDNAHSVPNNDCRIPKSAVSDSMDTASFDCANSFEYFPGDMCEPSAVRKISNEKGKFNTGKPQRVNSSLSMDLEENIACVRDILAKNQVSNKERKILIKELVERIVGSEYCDDFEEKNSSKKSTESSIKSEHTASTSFDSFSKLESKKCKFKKKEETLTKKSYVPYCPIPGGRTYHVMGAKVELGVKTSNSCSESDESRPVACYLPMDRVKVTQHSTSASEVRDDSPVSVYLARKHDMGYKSHLKTRDYTYEQNQKKPGAKFKDAKSHESANEAQRNPHGCFSKERPSRKSNWWSPVTKSEKKRINDTSKDKSNPLLKYVERERASQLHWIKNEINHLSNLAQLLEECAITKSDTPTSFEEQLSLLSSLRRCKKASKNVDNEADKLLSSAKSSSLEEPITPAVRGPQGPSRERVYRSTSPLLHRGSTQSSSTVQSSACSMTTSHSLPSRSSSRNMTNSEISYIPKVPGDKHANRQPEAYVITFETVTPKKDFEGQVASRKPLKEVRLRIPGRKGRNVVKETNECHVLTSLKEQLEVHRPSFVKTSDERKKCLEELAQLRSLRQMTRRKLLQFTLTAQKNLQNDGQDDLPKPKSVHAKAVGRTPGKPKENIQQHHSRVKRKHRPLPEIQRKEAERMKKQNYQTNRIMADIFSRRLQQKVLSGAVSLSNSVSVISSL